MNDLEHDLRELFDQRASGIDVPGLAPKLILKRGRRRQVGTVMTGVLACLVALGLAAAAIGQTRHPAVIPMGNGLSARSTTIGGVPVTAAAGWTLVDDWPMATVTATTSETCSSTATAVPVEGSGKPGEGNSSPTGSANASQSCQQSVQPLPAGVPVLQLANFPIPLLGSVCATGNYLNAAPLPADGVAVYVAAFPGGIKTQDVLDACPGASNITDGVNLTTFADRGVQTVYGGVVVAGSAASDDDIATAQDYLRSLGGLRIVPTTPQAGPGPGYVMASGQSSDSSWRLEAGITSLRGGNGGPGVGAILVTDSNSKSEAQTVDIPTQGVIADGSVDLGGVGLVQFGTATADVSAVDIALPSGGSVPATLLPWNLQEALSSGFGPATGPVWFAETPELGVVHARVASESTPTPTPSPGSGELTLRTRPGNGYVVSGHNLGHDWRLESIGGRNLEFFLDGSNQPVGTLTDLIGNESQIDVDGGTFIISLRDPTVTSLSVRTGATEMEQPPATTINGEWQRIQDSAHDDGRIWVIALPDAGSGLEQANIDLPTFVSWPSAPLVQGSLIGAGSDGVVSWALTWQDDHCIILRALSAEPAGGGPTDSGMSDCLHPWSDGNKPQVQLVNGATRSTIALLVTHQPPTTVTSPDLPKGALQCTDIESGSTFAGSTICVFPVDDQQRVEVDLDQGGTPIRPVVVRKDGLSTSVS